MGIMVTLKQDLENRLTQNIGKVEDIIRAPYNWPLLDSLRNEICNCILIDCSQAAVTLTNHLLEKTLKAVLMHNEPSNQNYTDPDKIEEHFENMNTLYGSKDLFISINACKKRNLITKGQAQVLHDFRVKFRNAFGHADPTKIFGETRKEIRIFNPLVHNQFQRAEVKVANFPFLQDTTQKEIADEECVNYFKYVDTIIREVIPKLFTRDPVTKLGSIYKKSTI